MKRTSRYIISIIAMAAILLGFRFIDEDFIKQLKAKLTEFNRKYPDERIYVQFDKTLYKPGEDIWYKVYVVNGTTMAPSMLSTVAYIELSDPGGVVLKRSDLYVDEGAAHGDLALDKDLPGGIYKIRAFTRWMENFSEENFFTKEITIQKVITPRLLLKIDFAKKAYGKSDIVVANLKVRNLKDQPIDMADIHATLNIEGNKFESKLFKTNSKGDVDITFQLPADLKSTDALLQVLVSSAGIEESISRSVPVVLNKIQLRFFPEGGDIVAGSNGRVAFEAINEFGKGADIEGVVTDGDGNTVATFESYHMGMGAFNLSARDGHAYTAKITRPQGIEERFPLPDVSIRNYSLSINEGKDSTIVARVFSRSEAQGFLIAHVHGQVYVANKLQLHPGWNESVMSTRSMPAGIASITLFNSEGNETAERLLFVNGHKTLSIELATDQKEYQPGDKVTLNVKTKDHSGKPLRANLSVAVVDDQLINHADDKQDNILSWLLMGSELKGKIEEPSFYFKEDEPKAKLAMDYLLMIHGWRRFTWKEVFSPYKPLAHMPENDKDVTGMVLSSDNKGTPSEVVLMELNNRKRIAKVKADNNGQFMFRNVDGSASLLILTKKPNVIEVNGKKSTSESVRSRNGYNVDYNERFYNITPVMEFDDQASNVSAPGIVPSPSSVQSDEIEMSADVKQLSEIVVTGYGVQQDKKLSGYSTVYVQEAQTNALTGVPSIEGQLSGRVSGVMVTQTQPGTGTNISIRGINSLGNQGEPLWVIDGVQMSRSLNSNFSIGSQISPADISSINIVKGAEAMALYGSNGSNGVIIVETKSKSDHFQYIHKTPKYSSMVINRRNYTMGREFYTAPNGKEERSNFNTTVFWEHTVVTDKDGKAKIQFQNNDAVSAFRIIAEGMSASGDIGRKEITYHTLLPFSLDTRLPNFLGFEDTLRIPIRVTNNTMNKISARLSLDIPKQLISLSQTLQNIEVEAGQTITVPASVVPLAIAGEFPVTISIESNGRCDKITQNIKVHPVGFPVRFSRSGKDINKTIDIPVREMERGSMKGEITFVTNVLDDLFRGVENMLQEPHGCFEQVSSSTFPNILALQYLRKTGKSNFLVEKKALNYIASGYRQLAAYEIRSGGFEWFGHDPAHEALSAFGLIEFTEMQKVYDGVNAQMVDCTKAWLLKRRDGKGGFNQNRGKYGFSAAPAEVNNAYIVYALSESGVNGVDQEYMHSLTYAHETKDMYLGALMANAAVNFNKMDDFRKLSERFSKAVDEYGFQNLPAQTSVTYSYGTSLSNEVAALWALALMKAPNPDFKMITRCLEFLGENKRFAMYGSTQATYLSLKAVTEYNTLIKSKRSDGTIAIRINNEKSTRADFNADTHENIIVNDFVSKLKQGTNKLEIAFENTREALPYSVDLTWNSKTPVSSEDCKLRVETSLKRSEVPVNETVRLSIKLKNVTQAGVPMSVALIGIPAGLSLQSWQLKELRDKQAFDFYEIIDNKLAIYYRELGPSETREINLDLKAELPGSFLSVASCAYLYYTSEFQHWVAGTKVEVR